MPMAAAPKDARYRGVFNDQLNDRVRLFHGTTDVLNYDANDLIITQAANFDAAVTFDTTVGVTGALTASGAICAQDVTIAGILSSTGDAGAAGGAAAGDAQAITGGAGSSTSAACVAPGVGGAVTITAGAGGASTACCDTAGAGGNLVLAAGAGGAATACCGPTGGAAGAVIIRLPTAVNCGAQGTLSILNSTTGLGLATATECTNVVTGAGSLGQVSFIACWAADWTTGSNTGVLLVRVTA